jgi:isoprenylcysteine carboxyl methyltransferase (ICMT) family protein YpbQ
MCYKRLSTVLGVLHTGFYLNAILTGWLVKRSTISPLPQWFSYAGVVIAIF